VHKKKKKKKRNKIENKYSQNNKRPNWSGLYIRMEQWWSNDYWGETEDKSEHTLLK
jgi:hypoxanthine phosphoribosyltransferase